MRHLLKVYEGMLSLEAIALYPQYIDKKSKRPKFDAGLLFSYFHLAQLVDVARRDQWQVWWSGIG